MSGLALAPEPPLRLPIGVPGRVTLTRTIPLMVDDGGVAVAIRFVPLCDRKGLTKAWAMIDADDLLLVECRAWSLTDAGYAQCSGPRTSPYRLMHRLIAGLDRGDPRVVDHINGIRLDNRRANLRVITHAENMQNRTANRAGSSRFRGVSWYAARNKWMAFGAVNGRRHHLGYFADEGEAALAAEKFRAEHMPYSKEARAE